MQKTVKRESVVSGSGLFTGEKSRIRLKPSAANSGIRFQRIDLPGKPIISAQIQNVCDTLRCTRLKTSEASIITVEHLLSTLSACEIDNALIEVEGPEIPSGDGSANAFVKMIDESGIHEQAVPKQYWTLTQPVFWSENETHIVALPSPEWRISYTLYYPQSPLLRSQYFTFLVNQSSFKEQIAPCRTFSLYEEIGPLIEKGLLKGGGLENAVVIQGDKVLNPGGVRFPDEMVRHKILDLIGDLSLLGCNLILHIIAIRSGHASNVAFAKVLGPRLVIKSQELVAQT